MRWGEVLFNETFYETVAFQDYWEFFKSVFVYEVIILEAIKQYKPDKVMLFPITHQFTLCFTWHRRGLVEGVFDGVLRYLLKKQKIRKKYIMRERPLRWLKERLRIHYIFGVFYF